MRLRYALAVLTSVALAASACGKSTPTAVPRPSRTTEVRISPSGQSPDTTAASSSPAHPAHMPMIVRETAFTYTPGGETIGDVYYTVIVENPNLQWFATDVSLRVVLKDARGGIVGVDTGYGGNVPPQTARPASSEMIPTGIPASIEVTVTSVDWQRVGGLTFRPFKTEQLEYVVNDGSYSITGTVTNPYNRPVDELELTGIVRDAAGKLLSGRFDFVSDVTPNSTTPFEVSSGLEPAPAGAASVEVYAEPNDISTQTWYRLVKGG